MSALEPLMVSERVVLVPRQQLSTAEAFRLASNKLEEQGLVALQLNGVSIDRDEASAVETYVLRVDVAPADAVTADTSEPSQAS